MEKKGEKKAWSPSQLSFTDKYVIKTKEQALHTHNFVAFSHSRNNYRNPRIHLTSNIHVENTTVSIALGRSSNAHLLSVF